MAATAVFALLLVTPATAQIVIGGDGNSSVTVNMDVLDGGTRGRLTTPGSDGRILLMPNAPREGQERIVLKPPASMRGAAQPAAPSSSAPALAAAPQLTPPASMRSTSRPVAAPAAPSVTPPTAPAVRAPTALQPQKPEAPKVAAPQIAAPKPAETPKPAAPAASTEKPQRTAALPSAKPEPVTPPAPKVEAKPEPKAETQTAPKPAEQRVAALPPQSSAPSQPAPAGITRLSFGFNQAEMDEAARTQLQAVAKRLQDNESLRVQLLAYAGGEGVSSSQARRLSLSRALAVRSQLIEQGIRSTRMDVRALGDTDKDGPADRVDIRIVDR
ncbi:lysophospholipase [Oceanibaculum indicum P24]|uniref:Lysophospholipase n=2 Tax=Oceanibaculum indicum TaxID=526216 RepID=K2IWF6_9PROT|nr:lysophospholipase [Oceanibaculum indicum P24]